MEIFRIQIPTDRTNETRTRATRMLTYKFAEICSTPLTTAPRRHKSLLPLVSKIFEKVVQTQTQTYLDRNNLLYILQSGFRQNYSTDTTLPYLTDNMQRGFDEGLFTGMILIDLKKPLTILTTILF